MTKNFIRAAAWTLIDGDICAGVAAGECGDGRKAAVVKHYAPLRTPNTKMPWPRQKRWKRPWMR